MTLHLFYPVANPLFCTSWYNGIDPLFYLLLSLMTSETVHIHRKMQYVSQLPLLLNLFPVLIRQKLACQSFLKYLVVDVSLMLNCRGGQTF